MALSELAACHGLSVFTAYTDMRHEVHALLHKIDRWQTKRERAAVEPPADAQNVTDLLERHSQDTHRPRRRREKLA
jgi:hypothetical protein